MQKCLSLHLLHRCFLHVFRSYVSMETSFQRRNQETILSDKFRVKKVAPPKSSLITHPKRNNSTDSTPSNSSTPTSQAESSSWRVLKPQSVEAINRKNILASAKCRSGQDLNGSPLIQRKFSDDEEVSDSNGGHENGDYKEMNCDEDKKEMKVAYIDVVEKEGMKSNSTFLEPSNDMEMWVRAEAKTLAANFEAEKEDKVEGSRKDEKNLEENDLLKVLTKSRSR